MDAVARQAEAEAGHLLLPKMQRVMRFSQVRTTQAHGAPIALQNATGHQYVEEKSPWPIAPRRAMGNPAREIGCRSRYSWVIRANQAATSSGDRPARAHADGRPSGRPPCRCSPPLDSLIRR